MKKIKHSTIDPQSFFEDVINAKHRKKNDADYKLRIIALKEANKPKVSEYVNAFNKNIIESIGKNNRQTQQNKEDLESLYSYRAKDIVRLHNDIIMNNSGYDISTCPFCENNSVSSFDHYLPKSIFPEFAVHPLNLTPCCHDCNGRKGDIWHQHGDKECFNVYIDEEPKEQFLFCDIIMRNGMPSGVFKLDGKNINDKTIFKLIENTYKHLELTYRYERLCGSKIPDLINNALLVRGYETSYDDIFDRLKSPYRINKNNWVNVFHVALLNDEASKKFIMAECERLFNAY